MQYWPNMKSMNKYKYKMCFSTGALMWLLQKQWVQQKQEKYDLLR